MQPSPGEPGLGGRCKQFTSGFSQVPGEEGLGWARAEGAGRGAGGEGRGEEEGGEGQGTVNHGTISRSHLGVP